MIELRRTLLVCVLAAAGCESGPTSDWPTHGSGDDKDSMASDAAVAGGMDASRPADAGVPAQDACTSDAGDAGCETRDR